MKPDASIPLVFVVGTGRCGTHTLWKLFESIPNTLSTHEGKGTLRSGPASSLGKKVVMGCMPEFNAYLYHYAGEDVFQRTFDPDPEMMALMDGSFAGRAKAIGWCEANGIAYCDANAFGFNFINYLHLKLPRARFVHLVRDGYACVRSWSRRAASTYPDEIPNAPSIEWLLAKPTPFPSDPADTKIFTQRELAAPAVIDSIACRSSPGSGARSTRTSSNASRESPRRTSGW